MFFSTLYKRRGATLAAIGSLALSSVVLLCAAGSVPVENFLPQGAMQGDLNAGGHSLTNAATVSATNVVISGSLTAPSSFTLSFARLTGTPTTLGGYGITDPVVLTSGSYANPSWLSSLAYSKLTSAPTIPPATTLTTTGSGAATYNSATGALNIPTPGAGGVTAFNTRTGAVTLTAADVNALSGLTINGVTLAGSGSLNVGSGGTLGSNAFTSTAYQPALTLTTTGSGAASLTGSTLNIPTPSSAYITALGGNMTGFSVTAGTLNLASALGTAAFTASSAYDASGAASAAQSNAQAFSANGSNITSGTILAARVATLNQNTTGSAAAFTGALAGDVTGTQGATTVGKINGTALATLGTGLLKNTTGSGVPSIAAAGTDYPGLGSANNFSATQAAPDFEIPTGPNGVIFDWAGDSRTGGPQGGGTIAMGPNAVSVGYINLVPARIQEMGFGYNTTVINQGLGGASLETGLGYYNNGGVTTTGTITAGSSTITITGSTTGLSTILTGATGMVAGPGIPYGLYASISGSTVTLHDPSGRGRTPSLSTTGASIAFAPAISVSNNAPVACAETFHQLSPAVNTATYTCTVTSGSNVIVLNSGYWLPPVGSTVTSAHFSGPATVTYSSANSQTIAVNANAPGSSTTEAVTVVPVGFIAFWYGINDVAQPGVYSSITSTSGSATLSGFSGLGTIIPGTQVTGANIPSSPVTTVVSNTSTTITLSANATASSSANSVTLTSTAAAWGAAYSTLVNEAVADGWTVEVLTIPRAYTGSQSTNETLRTAYNSYLVSTYGTETSPLVSTVRLCDVASLGIFTSFDQRIYADAGLHFSPLGNSIVAAHVNSVMEAQFPAQLTGYPMTLCQNQAIPSDWISFPSAGTNLILNGGLTLNPTANNNQTYLNMGSGYMRFNEGSPASFWFVGNGNIAQLPTSVTGYIPLIPQNATTVGGSTSGTATFVQTFNQGYKKEIIVSCSALVGTASFTFPTSFSSTPVILTTSGPASSVVTSLSTSAVTVTGATTTGPLFLEGF